MGGIETYLRALIQGLQEFDQNNSYTILCSEQNMLELELHNTAFTSKMCTYRKPSIQRTMRKFLWNTTRIDILKAEPRYQQLDLIHHPFTTMDRKWRNIPSVLTFWDMQHEFFPNFFNPRELKSRHKNYRPSVEAATRIIVSSSFTRDCLTEHYGTPSEKISIVYTGVSPDCRLITDQALLDVVKARYSLDRPFLYYPAATWPHKNHTALLQACQILKQQNRFDGNLVLTGIAMQAHDDIFMEIQQRGLEKHVKVLGYLPRAELPCLFSLARLMVFPSLFEGFGIPLVEAMACGCPVACSNTTSLPEVIGTAGVQFDPTKPEEIADVINRLWNDDDALSRMRQNGLSRALFFNWRTTAEKTLNVYRQTIS
jgi:glycosyltransferase involved in cell wall biosynthesis